MICFHKSFLIHTKSFAGSRFVKLFCFRQRIHPRIPTFFHQNPKTGALSAHIPANNTPVFLILLLFMLCILFLELIHQSLNDHLFQIHIKAQCSYKGNGFQIFLFLRCGLFVRKSIFRDFQYLL